MVIYDLVCGSGHQFEGWFKNANDYQAQQSNGLLECPICGAQDVGKRPVAPHVSKKSNSLVSAQEVAIGNGSAEAYEQLQDMLGQVHDFIEDNFEDVGNRFAEEALNMHRGESEPENIRGTANASQLKALAEEGVSAVALPPRPVDKKKLN